jgi:carbamoyl-phosphate synthase large subunit
MVNRNPIHVALTGMNAVPDNPGPGLAVARCLTEAYGRDVFITGLGYDALDPGLHLPQYTDASYLLPYPANGADALLARISEINALKPIDLLIPCLDAELPIMVGLAPTFARMGIHTFLPSADQLKRRAKDQLPELCRDAGVHCPQVKSLSNPAFFNNCQAEGWTYPMVVKGVFYDARVVHTPAEAVEAFHRIAREWGYPVLAQKFIAGEEYNLTAVGDGSGNLLGEVMMKKRAITAKGKAWAGVATNDVRLAEAARKLAAALTWRGPLEVEMMCDAKGNYHLIEINPRFPAWIYFSHGVGRNLPALLTALALGEALPHLAAPQPGVMFLRYAVETIVPMSSFESLMMNGNIGAPQPVKCAA